MAEIESFMPAIFKNALMIEAIGHQWWWEFRYIDTVSSRRVKTANELHLPVNRPVLIKGTSNDVIHSFWIPNLHGKKDLIPGQTMQLVLKPEKEGMYRGQCAEFCGHQHAKMGFWAIVESHEKFEQWVQKEIQPASEPLDSLPRRGKEVFMAYSCIMCHTIGGTSAGGNVAPDLTHFASRATIAAGSLPNNRGNLAAWILDPQSIKPGTKMPQNPLSPADLNALIAYLETLK